MKTYTDVISYFKGASKLAKALGCERQAVHQWEGRIPELRAYQIQVLTYGKFDAVKYLDSLEEPEKPSESV